MASARWGIPWEGLLLERAWPATFFVLILYAKLVKLGTTVLSAQHASETGIRLWADLAHQLATIFVFALVVGLFVFRRAVVGPRSNLLGSLVAIAGTWALTLVASAPVRFDSWTVLALSAALAVVGGGLTLVGLATLGRCFGLFPEARGLVTRGPYRVIRHPVYLGEFISGFGLLLPILSPWTILVFLAFVVLQVWRIFNEERALVTVFPEYDRYRERTWRLVPGVF